MKILVACEHSGTLRDILIDCGHDAYSCDLLPDEGAYFLNHIVGDVRDVLDEGWDMMIAHPPCTHLAVSGARWFKNKTRLQNEAIAFVKKLMYADIPRIAIENPVGLISTLIRKPDQIIHPWMFGHPCRKRTCLWLKSLPLLEPTDVTHQGDVYETASGKLIPGWYSLPPSEDRWKQRSKTFEGVAQAMAIQWTREN